MKKSISIVLVALLLMNVLGFYGIFVGLDYQNDRAMTQRLNADAYNTSETVTIKVPIAIPYHLDQEEFQRVEGMFEYNGEVFRLVKQRLSKDTLHIVCIRDHESGNISQALKDYVKTFSDAPSEGKQHAKTLSGFSKEYAASYCVIKPLSVGWSVTISGHQHAAVFVDAFFASIVHPPERA